MGRDDRDGSPPPDIRGAGEWRQALSWVVGAALARAWLGSMAPLFPDEAYYWDWTRRLEAGYFDHPPGVALLIAAGTALAGDTRLGIRLGPALAALVTHLGALLLAWQLGGRGVTGARSARRAAILVAVLPVATMGMVLATPDAPLFAMTMLALVAVERALAAPPRSATALAWWVAAGFALGGALVAKYTAILLPAGLVVACAAHPALRRRFAEPGPWVASVLALGLFAPVVLWNSLHHWVSFRFQLGHGFGPAPRGTPLGRELELLGGQVALASPILFGLVALAVAAALRDGWRARRDDATALAPRRFALGVVAVVPLAFFAVSAWRRSPEPNWPTLVYPPALVLLATTPAPWASGRWWRRGLQLAVALLAVLALQAWRPLLPLTPPRDPVARAYGWDALARAVEAARRDPFLDGAPARWVAANRYQEAGELAFHLSDHPAVFSLNLLSRTNQYDLWPTPAERVRAGHALVAVFPATARGDSLAGVVGRWFDATRPAATVALTREGGVIVERRVWLYRGARPIPPRPADPLARWTP